MTDVSKQISKIEGDVPWIEYRVAEPVSVARWEAEEDYFDVVADFVDDAFNERFRVRALL